MSLTKVSYSMIQGAVINVKDYGTVGNGVADDTAAIQAAIDACQNGTVFFPVGSYKVTDTLKIEYDTANGLVSTNLVGEGLGSLISWSGTNSLPVIWYEATSSLQGFYSKTRIENLHFINSGSAIDSIGIKLGNFSSPLGMAAGIQNFTISGCKLTSFDFCVLTEFESDTIQIYDNVFQSYKQRALYLPGSADVSITDNYFQFGGIGSQAISGETGSYMIAGNLIQSSNAVAGAIVLLKSGAITITGNYIEFPLGSAFAISIQQSSSGYIGSNSIQGLAGNDAIQIDSASRDINIGPNAYGFFGSPLNSFVKAFPGARGVSVIGNQSYTTTVSISNGSPAIVTSLANSPGWQVNQVVFFTTNGTLPTGLTAYIPYYIVNPSGATFQVAATISGTPINTSSAGTGDHLVNIVLATPYDGDASAFDFNFNNNSATLGVPNYTNTPDPGVTISRAGVLNIGNNAGDAGWGFVTFHRSGVNLGSIQQSGTTGINYGSVSDYRLKENVQPMENALATVAKLNPVTYNWKLDGSQGQGFIAHELQTVVSDCVTGKKDGVDEKGKPVYQAIDTSFLVATLAKAIQELKAEFDGYKKSHP